MEVKSLHIAMREAIEQFGFDVLTEGRLVNILLDYGAYSDVPASKTILLLLISIIKAEQCRSTELIPYINLFEFF